MSVHPPPGAESWVACSVQPALGRLDPGSRLSAPFTPFTLLSGDTQHCLLLTPPFVEQDSGKSLPS